MFYEFCMLMKRKLHLLSWYTSYLTSVVQFFPNLKLKLGSVIGAMWLHTCHMDTAEAYVWSLQNFVLREHILKPCPDNPTLAFLIFARSVIELEMLLVLQACAISACGNFAVVGTASGWIERFNLQSGISRGSYLDKSETRSYSHDGEVVGVACDSTNTLMISAGYHGDVKVRKVSQLSYD